MGTADRSRVLVAVDGTGECEAALEYACAEAVSTRAVLELVHVTGAEDETAPSLEISARHDAEKLTEGRIEIHSAVRRGPVVEVLVEASATARLLVVQHRRESRLERLRHGSTAVSLAGRVHCRMVSVPEDWQLRPHRGASGRTPAVVTVGIDAVDAETDRILGHAFRAAERENADLHVVHAWTMSNPYDDALVDARREAEWAAAYRARLGQVLAGGSAAHPHVEAEVHVLHQDAAAALVDMSAHSDLLLVGQGRGVHPLLDHLGSVPRSVLRDSSCPVEVVRTGSVP